MPDGLALALALVALAATLAVAVARPSWLSEAVAASVAAGALVLAGAVSVRRAMQVLGDLAPTILFLAALLLIADGCRREGLFDALGAIMARGSRGSPRRLLALVFVVAAGVTAVLSLDSTVVLLTPVVFATAARLRASPKPHVYACLHVANSASLLLPMSNLTNLLAFHASGLTFVRFAALMALPTAAALGVEWVVLTRFFGVDLVAAPMREAVSAAPPKLPRFAVAVLAATLLSFAVSSELGIEPAWVAAVGAAVISVPALSRRTATLLGLARVAQAGFLVFVLGLGVVVAAASDNGLASAVRTLLPAGGALVDLVSIAAASAVLANVVNNLPAILILTPVAAAYGHGPVLAALVGVNVGPNLTYVGSLATLLWRRVLHAEDIDVELSEFVRLGAITVPVVLVASTVLLWFAVQGLT
jgi:arsenical pump membrane protein